MNKYFNKINKLLLGENIFSPIRKRLFLLTVWVSVMLAVIGNIINITMGFDSELIIATFIIILILFILFISVRKNKSANYDYYIYLFWGIVIVIIPILWIGNSGMDSNIIMVIFVVFISMFLTVKPTHRIYTYAIVVALISTLLFVDYYFPNLILRYSNQEQRMVDLVLGYLLYLTLVYLLLNTIVKNSEYEQTRLNLRNRQLDYLSKEKDSLNKKLEETVKQLKEANNSKDRFIAIIAHDLRSPFQGLLGVSRLLDKQYDEIDETDRREMIKQISISLGKQYDFLEELLLWGRIQRNAIQIENQMLKISELINSIIKILEVNIEEKNISIEMDGCENDLVFIDRHLVSTVIRNILSNAIKFSNRGSKIIIKLSSTDDLVRIEIQDFGIGMSKEYINNLFKVDLNISRSGTEGESGSGLGLIVSSETIKQLKGTMKVDSIEGEGTIFTISLPRNINIVSKTNDETKADSDLF